MIFQKPGELNIKTAQLLWRRKRGDEVFGAFRQPISRWDDTGERTLHGLIRRPGQFDLADAGRHDRDLAIRSQVSLAIHGQRNIVRPRRPNVGSNRQIRDERGALAIVGRGQRNPLTVGRRYGGRYRDRVSIGVRETYLEGTAEGFESVLRRDLRQKHHGRRGGGAVNFQIQIKARVEIEGPAHRRRAFEEDVDVIWFERLDGDADGARNDKRGHGSIRVVKRDAGRDDKRLEIGCKQVRAPAGRIVLEHGLVTQLLLPFHHRHVVRRKVDGREIFRLGRLRNLVVESYSPAKASQGDAGRGFKYQREVRAHEKRQWPERGKANVNLHPAHTRNKRPAFHANIQDGVNHLCVRVLCNLGLDHLAFGVGGQVIDIAAAIHNVAHLIETHDAHDESSIHFHPKQLAAYPTAKTAYAGNRELAFLQFADVDDRIGDLAADLYAAGQPVDSIYAGREDQLEIRWVQVEVRPLYQEFLNRELDPRRQIQIRCRGAKAHAKILTRFKSGRPIDIRINHGEIARRATENDRLESQSSGGGVDFKIGITLRRIGINGDIRRPNGHVGREREIQRTRRDRRVAQIGRGIQPNRYRQVLNIHIDGGHFHGPAGDADR